MKTIRLAILIPGLLVCLAHTVLADAWLQLGPMVGHTGPREARIWAKASENAQLSVRIGAREDLKDGRVVTGPKLAEASDFMGHVRVTGLQPATRYHYAVLLDGKPAMSRPFPSFVTAPEAGKATRFRFAFVSCLGRNTLNVGAAWGDMAERAPIDLLLMLGDSHYADSTDPARIRPAYYQQRRVAGYQEITRTTPTYAIWDDHDYGPNNSDGTAEGKERSLQTFKEFWANPGYGHADNPGIYYTFSRGDVDFFMLDNRYHRSPNEAPEDGTKTMLGSAQLQWLKETLKASKAKVKFIAAGGEWQSHGSIDSWTMFDRERTEIFDFIETHGIEGVVLLSGDRHFTAAYQVRGKYLEVTSGPLGSGNNTRSEPAPESFTHHKEGKLWCVFDVDTTATEPKLALEIYRAGEGLLEQREFTWAEVTGRSPIAPSPSLAR